MIALTGKKGKVKKKKIRKIKIVYNEVPPEFEFADPNPRQFVPCPTPGSKPTISRNNENRVWRNPISAQGKPPPQRAQIIQHFQPNLPPFHPHQNLVQQTHFEPRLANGPDVLQNRPQFHSNGPQFPEWGPEFHPNGPQFPRHGPQFTHEPQFLENGPRFPECGPQFVSAPEFVNDPEFPPNGPQFLRNGPQFRPNDPQFSNEPYPPPNAPHFLKNGPQFTSDPPFLSSGPQFANGPEFIPHGPQFEVRPHFPAIVPQFSPHRRQPPPYVSQFLPISNGPQPVLIMPEFANGSQLPPNQLQFETELQPPPNPQNFTHNLAQFVKTSYREPEFAHIGYEQGHYSSFPWEKLPFLQDEDPQFKNKNKNPHVFTEEERNICSRSLPLTELERTSSQNSHTSFHTSNPTSSPCNESNKVFLETVTHINKEVGYAGLDIFFQTSICSLLPGNEQLQVGDKIFGEAEAVVDLPFKWRCIRVQKVIDPSQDYLHHLPRPPPPPRISSGDDDCNRRSRSKSRSRSTGRSKHASQSHPLTKSREVVQLHRRRLRTRSPSPSPRPHLIRNETFADRDSHRKRRYSTEQKKEWRQNLNYAKSTEHKGRHSEIEMRRPSRKNVTSEMYKSESRESEPAPVRTPWFQPITQEPIGNFAFDLEFFEPDLSRVKQERESPAPVTIKTEPVDDGYKEFEKVMGVGIVSLPRLMDIPVRPSSGSRTNSEERVFASSSAHVSERSRNSKKYDGVDLDAYSYEKIRKRRTEEQNYSGHAHAHTRVLPREIPGTRLPELRIRKPRDVAGLDLTEILIDRRSRRRTRSRSRSGDKESRRNRRSKDSWRENRSRNSHERRRHYP